METILVGALVGAIAVVGLGVGWRLNSAYNRRILRGAKRARGGEPPVAWSEWAEARGLALADHRNTPGMRRVERVMTGETPGGHAVELRVACHAVDVRSYTVRGWVELGASEGRGAEAELEAMGFRCERGEGRLRFEAVNGWLRYDEVAEEMAEGVALSRWWGVMEGLSSG